MHARHYWHLIRFVWPHYLLSGGLIKTNMRVIQSIYNHSLSLILGRLLKSEVAGSKPHCCPLPNCGLIRSPHIARVFRMRHHKSLVPSNRCLCQWEVKYPTQEVNVFLEGKQP